jgi:hypothetical protein
MRRQARTHPATRAAGLPDGTALDEAAIAMRRFPLVLLRALVRRTWLIAAITIVCCAAFAARAATAVVDADYLLPMVAPGPRAAAPPPAPVPAAIRPRLRPDPFADRNPFCSTCTPGSSDGPVDVLTLQAAQLIAIDVGLEARATVRVVASEVQGSWGTGDAIPGLGRIDRIGLTWVEIVDNGGRHGRLSLRDPAAGQSGAGLRPVPVPGSASDCGAAGAAWADRVRRFDEQNYEVERELVRELVTGVSKAGGVRPVPVMEGGEIRGIRLLGVRPCTIATALGLLSGDLLSAIDGAPLRNAQQLFDLYAKLDQVSVVELSGTRGGKPLVRTLRLR